ncbi:hypothetical protein JCM33374_g1156 [Metschnikowia sp. JCM 33374]|nr:hypothetical protein JCM33374_g1156 [Metschnikowia sp. JCM 33374]
MPKFANSYWSPDYGSGIDKLSRQTVLSLGQLHELRKFIFSYMKYFHANGEYLANLADTSYPIDSHFRTSRGPRVDRLFSGVRKVSRSGYFSEDQTEFDMNYVFRQFVDRTRSDSRLHQTAASDIDRLILDSITLFLKHHEPQMKMYLAELADSLEEYMRSYEKVEKIKQEYTTIARLGEFSIHKESEFSALTIREEPDQETSFSDSTDEESTSLGTGLNSFKFPLVVAGVSLFPDHLSFSKFISTLVESVPITKRKIPLPGYRNEIFSSEQLCDTIKKERPRAFNPTRSNLEKLGQILLDKKLLVGTGFFSKKFNSEGMWFEWSDLTIELSGTRDANIPLSNKENSRNNQSLNIPKLDEKWSNMTSNTTRRFNGVFKSMQNTLAKSRFSEEDLSESEEKYNEAYRIFQKQKHLLEMKIHNASQTMEQFEKLKIEIVYQSLTKLSEVLQKTNSTFSAEFDKFSKRFVAELNTPENYLLEFNKGLNAFSTGLYFPSILAPDHLTNRHVDTSQLNTNFQNIRFNFNLFKDIPLQEQLADKQPDLPLSMQSIPIFFFESVKALERFPIRELADAWRSPINYQKYWLMKDNLINQFQRFQSEGTEISVVHSTELALLKIATSFLDDKDVSQSVNFIKNWLLEISDSIIPSTVHDSLIANYKITRKGDEGNQQRLAETLKVLGTIPRSNLSSLIYVLEHMAKTFELDVLKGFGHSDKIEFKSPSTDEETLNGLAVALNSLEAISAIPFLHLIMRPSIVKHSGGYRPPLEQYNLLLKDLLGLDIRQKLFQVLVTNEHHFIKRQEQQKQNLGIPKIQEPRERSSSINSMQKTNSQNDNTGSILREDMQKQNIHESPRPLKSDNFELRPFRTGNTPRPSPSASPVSSMSKTIDMRPISHISLTSVSLEPDK